MGYLRHGWVLHAGPLAAFLHMSGKRPAVYNWPILVNCVSGYATGVSCTQLSRIPKDPVGRHWDTKGFSRFSIVETSRKKASGEFIAHGYAPLKTAAGLFHETQVRDRLCKQAACIACCRSAVEHAVTTISNVAGRISYGLRRMSCTAQLCVRRAVVPVNTSSSIEGILFATSTVQTANPTSLNPPSSSHRASS